MTGGEIWGLLTVWDLLDVLVVAFLIYNLILLIRGTRAVQMVLGIVFLALLYGLSQLGNFPTLQSLLGNLPILLPVAVLILFQQELRRALASFGRNPLWGLGKDKRVAATFDDIVSAASTLSNRRHGALIVLEREEGLRNYIESGIELDANLTLDLLVTLFHPETPLHDGAVIVQNDRLAAASCFLPLTTSSATLSTQLGTRHRAALGISEETDAVAVVVSEETGTLSIAVDGRMIRDLDTDQLLHELHLHLVTSRYPQAKGILD